MRKETQLLTAGENVSFASRASAAADRHGGRDYIRDANDIDRTPRVLTLSSLLQGVFTLNLKTKNGETLSVPIPVWGFLITILLAFCAGAYTLIANSTAANTKVDMALRDLTEIKAMQRESDQRLAVAFETTNAYISAHTSKVQFMTGLLTPTQQRQVNEWDRAHPAPKPPDPDIFRFNKKPPPSSNDNEEGSTSYVRSGL